MLQKETDMCNHNVCIMLAGGSGSRMNAGMNKVLINLNGKTVLERSLEAFLPFVENYIVVYRNEDEKKIRDITATVCSERSVSFVVGGSSRQESVENGLSAIKETDAIVLIHDAARCLVDSETIQLALNSAENHGSGIPAIEVTDTIKETTNGETIQRTVDRNFLRAVQTPQCFQLSLIRNAYAKVRESGIPCTDDASVLEALGVPVRLTKGNKNNIKLTTMEDLAVAEMLITQYSPLSFRIGHGYDVHRLVADRKLILCGVDIPHSLGLLGHSDADVALHALMDAMLGALALGDIGHLFPDNDPQYKGISSLLLLKHVNRIIEENGYQIGNCDITIAAQKPKLAPYISNMRKNIADILHCSQNLISVKATTTEKLGFEGAEEGISAQAVCLLTRK